jgi:cobalt-precorrin-5B (C1)-methyltransferase
MADEPRRGKALREGYSTGACAAAAAKAAAIAVLSRAEQREVTIDLPIGRRVTFAVSACETVDGRALCTVIKDAGDDPDCTHGAEIVAEVRLCPEPGVTIDGGDGVARVTKGGLGIEVGEAAITRVPRRMIAESVLQALEAAGHAGGAAVVISVPGGVEMAKKTLNHRLGLIGGISILGTSGIVKPYSTAAYKVSIVNAIDVAVAEGLAEVVLTTGGKSEEYAQRVWPLPESAFVQMGDWVGFTLAYCRKKKLTKVDVAGMIGKLSKIAEGEFYTHARQSAVNLDGLAAIADSLGAAADVVDKIRRGNTAREAQEIVIAHAVDGFFDQIAERVSRNCREYVEGTFAVETIITDSEGVVLGRAVAA